MASASRGRELEALTGRALTWLLRAEAAAACAGLALVIGALLADIVAREFFGSGLFGAQRFAVYCNSIGSLIGFAIVVHTGGHLRLSLIDRLFPAGWNAILRRAGDGLSAFLCVLLAYFAFRFVASTYRLGDTDPVFQLRIWPLQAVLPYIFTSSALRYACYALFPGLRPEEREAPGEPQ